jgi:hypothetical protein
LFRSNKPKIANFRTDYAKHADFCEVFEQDTRLLYLLAFLLTTNHKESEQCFVLTVEEAFKEQTVFKEWARSWVKRRADRERDQDCFGRVASKRLATGSLERRATRGTQRMRN